MLCIGTTNTGKLSGGAPTVHLDKKPNSGQHLKRNKIPSVNTEPKMCTSESSSQLNLKKQVLVENSMTQNSTFRYGKWYQKTSTQKYTLTNIYITPEIVKSVLSFLIFYMK